LYFTIFLATGYRLCRGYKVHATENDRPVDVTHLVFVIHGIGQKMDTGRIIRNTSVYVHQMLFLLFIKVPNVVRMRVQ